MADATQQARTGLRFFERRDLRSLQIQRIRPSEGGSTQFRVSALFALHRSDESPLDEFFPVEGVVPASAIVDGISASDIDVLVQAANNRARLVTPGTDPTPAIRTMRANGTPPQEPPPPPPAPEPKRKPHPVVQSLQFAWALPGALIGLLLYLVCIPRGRPQVDPDGDVHCPVRWTPKSAWTWGWVALYSGDVASLMAHEKVHIAQWKLWGPLFPVAYLLAWVAVGFSYRKNYFERQAYERA